MLPVPDIFSFTTQEERGSRNPEWRAGRRPKGRTRCPARRISAVRSQSGGRSVRPQA